MHYYLKINDTVIPNVSKIDITETYRNETVTYSLGGSMTIDRIGNTRLNVVAKVNKIDQELMSVVKDAVRRATNTTVEFYQGNYLRTKKMRISPFTEPSPLYYFDDRTNGFIYGSFELEMEEV